MQKRWWFIAKENCLHNEHMVSLHETFSIVLFFIENYIFWV